MPPVRAAGVGERGELDRAPDQPAGGDGDVAAARTDRGPRGAPAVDGGERERGELGRGLRARGGVGAERAGHELGERRGEPARGAATARGAGTSRGAWREGSPLARRRARQQLHQRAAQRIDVRAAIDGPSTQHFRREVAHRPDDRDRRLGHAVRDAEVGDVRVLAVQQHVRGLDVTVQHALRVRRLHGARDLHDQRDRAPRTQRPARDDPAARLSPSISRIAMYGTPSCSSAS